MQKEESWDLIIRPKNKWYDVDLIAIWKYRDLLFLTVKRDFVASYKQTALGPIWLFIQPVLTTLTYTLIFGSVARLSTDGVPRFLFYLAGISMWAYFADCFSKTSNTFTSNAGVFGKVYFPRLIMPLSVLLSNLVKFGAQFLLFLVVWIYYLVNDNTIHPNWNLIWLLPFLIIILAFLGFGFGILISSFTTKYRDLSFLTGFGLQLLMYASPIVYPLSIVPDKYKIFSFLNPVTSVIESFKNIFLGTGELPWFWLGYSVSFMLVLLFISIIVFNKVEKSFMDTV
jgi:lipopolysaccharide transport system permease protein